MKPDDLEPVDAELERLLESEKRATPSPSALDRVWKRVGVTIGSGMGDGGPGHEGADRPRPGRGGLREVLSSHVGSVALAAFAAGGLVGAAIHAAVQRPLPERVVYVERPPALPVAAPPPPSAAPQQPAPPTSSAAAIAATSPRAPAATASGSSLSAERALLDGARTALTAGETPRALALLDEHARRFPRPQLGEEREALAIQALVAVGRYVEARARAARFRASTPNSLFLPAIDATLASIP